MTAYIITLMYFTKCDMCLQWCEAGDEAYYNPNSRKTYHIHCIQDAECGRIT